MIMGKESKMRDFIDDYKIDTITLDRLYLKEVEVSLNKKMILLGDDILSKYRGEFDEYIGKITLTPAEKRKWHYNPKVMSYDLYGTTEFWFLLLELNEIRSITEFNMNPVKYFTTDITDKINRILNLENIVIEANNAEIQNKLNT